MMLMTKEIEATLPALYSQDGKDPKDVQVVVKFFDPTGSWSWYATEGNKTEDGDWEFFGYVKGFEGELGYFTLNELIHAKDGMTGLRALPIERDRHFKGTLAEVMAKESARLDF